MAVKIRLQRRGKKKQPIYRVVIQDSRVARNGSVIDILGQYNPIKTPALIEINEDKVKEWIAKGALPTKPVERILAQQGIIERKQPIVKKSEEKPKSEKIEEASDSTAETKEKATEKSISPKETKEVDVSVEAAVEDTKEKSEEETKEAPKAEKKSGKKSDDSEEKVDVETDAAKNQSSDQKTEEKPQQKKEAKA